MGLVSSLQLFQGDSLLLVNLMHKSNYREASARLKQSLINFGRFSWSDTSASMLPELLVNFASHACVPCMQRKKSVWACVRKMQAKDHGMLQNQNLPKGVWVLTTT
jgi:predicted glycosyl hydrolase (DUF1957 family)